MIIGIPKEIKNNENRVAMTPAGVHELVKHGHTVLVQKTAGEGSGFSDEDYVSVGCRMSRLRDGTPRRPLFTVAYSYVGSGWKNVCAGGYVFPRTPARRQRCAARGCSGCQAG